MVYRVQTWPTKHSVTDTIDLCMPKNVIRLTGKSQLFVVCLILKAPEIKQSANSSSNFTMDVTFFAARLVGINFTRVE